MTGRRAFTLIELLVVAGLILLIIAILVPAVIRHEEIANRTQCSANLTGIYKAMYTYSVTNSDSAPMYASAGKMAKVKGFKENLARNTTLFSTPTDLMDNATAGWWILVRQGATPTKIYTCPSTQDRPDPLTVHSTRCASTKTAVPLDQTFDFACDDYLSYSTMNWYRRPWIELFDEPSGSRVTMSDDNNNDTSTATRHTWEKGASGLTQSILEQEENSTNHSRGEGQNILYGDSHVKFLTDPFGGISNDNSFAYDISTATTAERATLPTLANNAPGDVPMVDNRQSDDCMIPVTGNRGVNLQSP